MNEPINATMTMMTIGTGIGPMYPWPNQRKESGKPMMFLDCAMMYPMPLKMEAVPSVMMSGWIFSLMERKPFNAPSAVPSTRMVGMARIGGIL